MNHHSSKPRPLLKRGLAVLGAVTLATSAAACGAGSGQSGDAADSGPVTISYFSWHNEEVARPVIEKFEEQNPDIRIDFSYAPPVAEYVQTLQTRIAGNQSPDVFRISPETRENLIAEGLVRDLSDEPWVDTLADANRNAYTRDGKLYGASFGAWEAGIFFNKELLQQVGANEVPDTWDEFLELCKKLKDAGITPYLESVSEIPKIFQAFLGQQYAKEGTPEAEQGIFTGDTSFEKEWPSALEEWHRLYDEGIVGVESVSLTNDQVRDQFAAGQVAMITTGPWDIPPLTESGVDFGIGFIPSLEAGIQVGAGAADPGYAISSSLQGEKLDAAQRLLTWLASEEGLSTMSANFGDMVTSSVYNTPVPEAYQAIYEDGLKESAFYLCIDHWLKGGDALVVEGQAQIQQYVQGAITAEQVAQAMDKKLATL